MFSKGVKAVKTEESGENCIWYTYDQPEVGDKWDTSRAGVDERDLRPSHEVFELKSTGEEPTPW